jgi:hypothetical protein
MLNFVGIMFLVLVCWVIWEMIDDWSRSKPPATIAAEFSALSPRLH